MQDRDAFKEAWEAIPNRAYMETCPVDETLRSEAAPETTVQVSLPTVSVGRTNADDGAGLFSVKSVLGRGGMGVVHLATQGSMAREVALKEVGRGSKRGLGQLLREGHVMGYLEHPNIIPIHVFAQDQSGQPFIAMKRVDGESFKELLLRYPGEDRRAEHLGVLRNICNALEYAHARGIVHLDLKPANIMVGAYGETYVVDWGTAVAFRDDVPGEIPRFRRENVVGTPCYLAPEMADRTLEVGPHTDQYLLGGILHAILTGRAPHGSGPMAEVVERAFAAVPPTFPPTVPAELAAICQRALARDPQARFESVQAFREALVRYEDHAAADHLVRQGHRKFEALQAILQDEPVDEGAVNRAYGATRQLLDESLELWEGHPGAREGLQTVIETMVRFELDRGNTQSAARLLRDLPAPNPELQHRCDEAIKLETAARTELDALRKDVDPVHEARVKALFLTVTAAVIGVSHLVPAIGFGVAMDVGTMMAAHGGLILAMLVVSVMYRARLFGTLANRSVVAGAWVLVIYGFFLMLGTVAGLFSLATALAFDLTLVAMLCAFVGVTVDRRIFVIVPGYAAFAAAAAALPAYAHPIWAAAHVFNILLLAGAYYRAAIRRSRA